MSSGYTSRLLEYPPSPTNCLLQLSLWLKPKVISGRSRPHAVVQTWLSTTSMTCISCARPNLHMCVALTYLNHMGSYVWVPTVILSCPHKLCRKHVIHVPQDLRQPCFRTYRPPLFDCTLPSQSDAARIWSSACIIFQTPCTAAMC